MAFELVFGAEVRCTLHHCSSLARWSESRGQVWPGNNRNNRKKAGNIPAHMACVFQNFLVDVFRLLEARKRAKAMLSNGGGIFASDLDALCDLAEAAFRISSRIGHAKVSSWESLKVALSSSVLARDMWGPFHVGRGGPLCFIVPRC
jgi:hypothetical protein